MGASGGEAPEEVKAGIVGGHSVEVEWLTSERFQTIYYDREHQLVWQKDEPEPESFFARLPGSNCWRHFRRQNRYLIGCYR